MKSEAGRQHTHHFLVARRLRARFRRFRRTIPRPGQEVRVRVRVRVRVIRVLRTSPDGGGDKVAFPCGVFEEEYRSTSVYSTSAPKAKHHVITKFTSEWEAHES